MPASGVWTRMSGSRETLAFYTEKWLDSLPVAGILALGMVSFGESSANKPIISWRNFCSGF